MALVYLHPDKEYKVGKIVGVGHNYAKHIEEMSASKSKEPVLFLKPSTAILAEGRPIILPDFSAEVHHEIELAILIGEKAKNIVRADWRRFAIGAGVALDLTLRDLQLKAKKAGLPWSTSKGFDGSCPISTFIPLDQVTDLQNLQLELKINGQLVQQGRTKDMIFTVEQLVEYISSIFTLEPGDIILTGTPAGVGKLSPGDFLEASINEVGQIRFTIE